MEENLVHIISLFKMLNMATESGEPELLDAAMDLSEFGAKLADEVRAELAQIETPDKLSLAEMLSGVLNHKDLPAPLLSNFRHALDDFHNSEIDQSEILEYEKSPEHIARILRGYKREAENE